MNLPLIIALLAGIWAAWLLWEFVGKRELFASRAAKRAATYLAEEGAVVSSGPFERELLAAGFARGQAMFTLICGGLGIAAFLLMSGFGMPPVIAAVGGALAFWFPRNYISGRAKGKGRKIDQELPSALTRIASLVNLQPDPIKLLASVADTLLAVNPLSVLAREFRTTVAQASNSGADIALRDLEARAASPALASAAFSLRVYAKAGGSYSGMLQESAERARTIINGRNLARAKASDALATAKILPALLLAMSVFLMQDPMFRVFYTSFIGQIVVAGAVGAMLAGYQVMKSMIEGVG